MTTHDDEQLPLAQWVLERHLHWVAAAEVKAGAVLAINAGMLGVLGTLLGASDPMNRPPWAWLVIVPAFVSSIVACFSTAKVVLPRVSGPDSLIFFGKVANIEVNDYVDRFRKRDAAATLRDCLEQIHRNAEIARDKFGWVRVSMVWTFVALPFWVMSLVGLVEK